MSVRGTGVPPVGFHRSRWYASGTTTGHSWVADDGPVRLGVAAEARWRIGPTPLAHPLEHLLKDRLDLKPNPEIQITAETLMHKGKEFVMEPEHSSTALHLVTGRPRAQTVFGALAAALLLWVGLGKAWGDSTIIVANDPGIQYVGRFDQTTPTAPAFDWSHSCIRAKFQGTSCWVLLGGISKYFDVYVDGTNTESIMSDNSGVETLPVASGLSNGVHTVAIYRRDEAGKGLNTFQGFILDSGTALIAPDPPPFRRMEFIGDSYTCGYGVLGAFRRQFFLRHRGRRPRLRRADGKSLQRRLHGDRLDRGGNGQELQRPQPNFRLPHAILLPENLWFRREQRPLDFQLATGRGRDQSWHQ